jgi:quinol monooxygenase YgiN
MERGRHMSSPLTVVAKVIARGDAIEAVASELMKLIEPTRQEQGCIEYTLHSDNQEPAVFVFYETWENRSALDRHMNSAHFRTYISAVEGMIAEKEVHLMTRVA